MNILKNEKVLSKREKILIQSALIGLNKDNFHYTDAPVDRKIILANGRLWVYWLQDFCPITRQWFRDGLRKIPFSVAVDNKVSYQVWETEPGLVILKFSPGSPFTKKAVCQKILEEKEKYLVWLLKCYQKNAKLLERKIRNCELKKDNLRASDISELFNALTTFVSIAPEKIFPYKAFEEILKSYKLDPQIQQSIFYSERSGYKETYLEFIRLTLQIQAGYQPDLDGFKNRIGFIGVTDLKEAPLEKNENILTDLKHYSVKFPTNVEMRIEKAILESTNYQWLKLQKTAIKKILAHVPEKEKPFMRQFLRFAKTVASSNENRRFLVTKAFKIIRLTLQNLNLDSETTTLVQLLEAIEKEKGESFAFPFK